LGLAEHPRRPQAEDRQVMLSAQLPAVGGDSTAVKLLVVVSLLSILPGVLLAVTGFTRILIVLGFVRNALGTPTTPPNQILIGIAFFLSLFVMGPTLKQVNHVAVQPYRAGKLDAGKAVARGLEPLRTFMFKQTRTTDLALFVKLDHGQRPKTRADVPTQVLIPAFIL